MVALAIISFVRSCGPRRADAGATTKSRGGRGSADVRRDPAGGRDGDALAVGRDRACGNRQAVRRHDRAARHRPRRPCRRVHHHPRALRAAENPRCCASSPASRRRAPARVAIDGAPVDGLPPDRRDIAMVFQSYALYPHLTVAENIAVPLRMRRLTRLQRLPGAGVAPGVRRTRAGIAEAVQAVAGTLRIESLLQRKPGAALGRPEAARGTGARHGAPASRLPDGRAAQQSRRRAACAHAGGDRPAPPAAWRDFRLRDARPGRGDDHVGSRRGHSGWRVAPDRLAGRSSIATPTISPSPSSSARHASMSCRPRRPQPVSICWVLRSPLASGLPVGTRLQVGIRPERLAESGAGARTFAGRLVYRENLGSDLFLHVALDGAAGAVDRALRSDRQGRPVARRYGAR